MIFYVPWSRCHTLTNLFGTIQYVSLSKCIYYNKRHYKYDPLYRFLFKRYYPVPSNTQNTWFIYNMEMEKRRGRDGTNLIVPVPKKNLTIHLKNWKCCCAELCSSPKLPRTRIKKYQGPYDRLAISPDSPTDSPIYITRQMESIWTGLWKQMESTNRWPSKWRAPEQDSE